MQVQLWPHKCMESMESNGNLGALTLAGMPSTRRLSTECNGSDLQTVLERSAPNLTISLHLADEVKGPRPTINGYVDGSDIPMHSVLEHGYIRTTVQG